MRLRLTIILIFLALLARSATAQERAHSKLQPGEAAPPFLLSDVNGNSRTLNGMLEKKPYTVIVFLRSAVWCRYCREQLTQLNNHQERLDASGIQVVTISYDKISELKKITRENRLSLTMLSDPQSRVIDAYDVRDSRVKNLPQYDGHAYPVTFLVDQSGIIRSVFTDSTKDRHSVDDLVKVARSLRSNQN